MLNFCDFIQVFVFTPNHHLNNVFDGQLLFSESSCLYISATLVAKVMAIKEI